MTTDVQNVLPLETSNVAQGICSLSELTSDEVASICYLISAKEIRMYFQKNPKEFAKIRPGFRAASLSDDDAIALMCKNAARPFVASFLETRVRVWLQEIQDYRSDLEQSGASAEESILKAIPKSLFSKNVDLFFKVSGEKYPNEYVKMTKTAISLLSPSETSRVQENGTSNTAEYNEEPEVISVNVKNAELSELLSELQDKIKSEQSEHNVTKTAFAKLKEAKDVLQVNLDEVMSRERLITEKTTLMQAELEHFHQLSKYADTELAAIYNHEYEYTSICRVFYNSTGKLLLFRLADIINGEILKFVKNEDEPPYYGNRDRLFWSDGPKDDGYIGVWQWNAEPNKSDPDTDYITTTHNDNIKIIEIIELPHCHSYNEIGQYLLSNSFSSVLGSKILFVCQNANEQLIGLLCNEKDYDVNNGEASIRHNVYTLPQFEIATNDVLTIAGKKIYRFTSLGMPNGMFKTKSPLSVVKETILARATSAVLRRQGLSKKEVQHCQSFLKGLPLQTVHQEIAEAYSCTEETAQEYVQTFLEQSESYLTESDLDIETLAVALKRNKELVGRCKELLALEWEQENADKLRHAEKQLESIDNTVAAKNTEISNLETAYYDLRTQKEELQAEINKQIALADGIKNEIHSRITSSGEELSKFLAQYSMFLPTVQGIGAKDFDYGSVIDSEPDELTENALFDCLKDNLEVAGVKERSKSAALSAFLLAAYSLGIPLVIAGFGAELIVDALSATLFNRMSDKIYTANGIGYVADGCSKIITVHNGFGEMSRVISKQGKSFTCFLAQTSEEMLIEPRSLYNYAIPVFSEYFVTGEQDADGFYGTIFNGKLIPRDSERKASVPSGTLPPLASNRINRLLGSATAIYSDLSDYDTYLLTTLPVMFSLSKHDGLTELIQSSGFSDGEKKSLFDLLGAV